jgi:CRISPR/Cas system CSM-associated protein Csm3 (group 7 of RAMP superfamily)
MTDVLRAEPGGVRQLRARWVFTAGLALCTPANLGSGKEGPADLSVVRDRMNGVPLLPGASLAGALRSYLCDRLDGYRAKEQNPGIARLFGTQRTDETGSQSALICFDSLGTAPDGRLEIRDDVAIDAATGTAGKHKKYDMELLPCGTTFPLRVELLVDEDANESELMSLLVAALEGLRPGEITLGARGSRGFGQVEARSWQAHRHDLTTGQGWLAWLLSDPLAPIPDKVAEHADPATASKAAAPTGVEIIDEPDQRRKLIVEAVLEIDRSLLVRSPAATADAPDAAHLVSGDQGILPGTSLAGVLRARVPHPRRARRS